MIAANVEGSLVSDFETEAARRDAPDPALLTRLASEQTYLAWSRTALSAFGLSIAIGGVLPAITDGSDWLLIALGAAFGLLGVALLAHGHLRHEAVLRAIDRGQRMPPDLAQRQALTIAGVILGVALIVGLVIIELRS